MLTLTPIISETASHQLHLDLIKTCMLTGGRSGQRSKARSLKRQERRKIVFQNMTDFSIHQCFLDFLIQMRDIRSKINKQDQEFDQAFHTNL